MVNHPLWQVAKLAPELGARLNLQVAVNQAQLSMLENLGRPRPSSVECQVMGRLLGFLKKKKKSSWVGTCEFPLFFRLVLSEAYHRWGDLTKPAWPVEESLRTQSLRSSLPTVIHRERQRTQPWMSAALTAGAETARWWARVLGDVADGGSRWLLWNAGPVTFPEGLVYCRRVSRYRLTSPIQRCFLLPSVETHWGHLLCSVEHNGVMVSFPGFYWHWCKIAVCFFFFFLQRYNFPCSDPAITAPFGLTQLLCRFGKDSPHIMAI